MSDKQPLPTGVQLTALDRVFRERPHEYLDRLRAEAQIAITLLLEQFPGLRLDPRHAIEHKDAPVFNGLTALWVRCAQEPGDAP
jgi:hypothetical protein